MALVHVFENHDEAYHVWAAAGIRAASIVHVDAHHDLTWLDDPFHLNIANYLCQAIKDGIAACVSYTTTQNPWSSENRTPELMKILLTYGGQAKTVIPELQQIADGFEKGEKDFPKKLSLQKAKSVRETIQAIEASNEFPDLIDIK